MATDAPTTPRHWLFKSEPDVFSIDDLRRRRQAPWDGVRNYTARNFLRDQVAVGDLVLFYHSSTEPPGVVGLARIHGAARWDETAFDEAHDGYDPKSSPDNPRWVLVDVEFVAKFEVIVTLAALKADPTLASMLVVQRGQRLSIQPVERDHFERIIGLGGLGGLGDPGDPGGAARSEEATSSEGTAANGPLSPVEAATARPSTPATTVKSAVPRPIAKSSTPAATRAPAKASKLVPASKSATTKASKTATPKASKSASAKSSKTASTKSSKTASTKASAAASAKSSKTASTKSSKSPPAPSTRKAATR
ncbi:MAG: EVE domain-containing protein [Nannocystaceae bacterium]